MDSEYTLSEPDREKFLQMWRDFVSRRGPQQRQDTTKPPQAPEVYVARTPTAGIPALGVEGTGTSTDDVPGSADCPIYQLVDAPGTAEDAFLSKVGQVEHTVYNVGEEDVPGDRWVVIIRDKFGKWLVVGNEGSGGDRWRFVKPTSENVDANGMYPGRVQDWNGSGYVDGDYCWIKLASGETVISGERYEGEPLTWIEDSQTGTANDPVRIYGIAGNTIECAPDECDENGDVVSWARIKHRAPFEIITGFTEATCAEPGGTGTAEA